jgi:hypothetical protein
MAAILSPLSLYGGNRENKLPLLHNTRIHTREGHFGNSRRSTIGQMPGGRTSLSLDASLTMPTHVLLFEVSQRTQIPSPPAEPPVLDLWLNQGTRRFCGELPQTPRTRCNPHANLTHEFVAVVVPVRCWFGRVNQPNPSCRLRL